MPQITLVRGLRVPIPGFDSFLAANGLDETHGIQPSGGLSEMDYSEMNKVETRLISQNGWQRCDIVPTRPASAKKLPTNARNLRMSPMLGWMLDRNGKLASTMSCRRPLRQVSSN